MPARPAVTVAWACLCHGPEGRGVTPAGAPLRVLRPLVPPVTPRAGRAGGSLRGCCVFVTAGAGGCRGAAGWVFSGPARPGRAGPGRRGGGRRAAAPGWRLAGRRVRGCGRGLRMIAARHAGRGAGMRAAARALRRGRRDRHPVVRAGAGSCPGGGRGPGPGGDGRPDRPCVRAGSYRSGGRDGGGAARPGCVGGVRGCRQDRRLLWLLPVRAG